MGVVTRRTAFPSSIKAGDRIGIGGEFISDDYVKCLATVLEVKDVPCILENWRQPQGVAGTYKTLKVMLSFNLTYNDANGHNVLEPMPREVELSEIQYISIFYERDFCREFGIKRHEILAAEYKLKRTKKGA